MALPPTPTPRALIADLRNFWHNQRRANWLALALAFCISGGLFLAFFFDSMNRVDDRETVTFINSWPASRTDAQIRADQQRDQAERDRAEREHRRRLQEIDQTLNRYGI